MWVPTCRCLKLELNPTLWQAQRKGLIFKEQRLGEANPALYSKPCLTRYLVFFRLRLFYSVGCWTLCNPSSFNWLFFVQINRSSAITSISQNPRRSESLQQIPLPHWKKSEFCQGFQWSQDFTSKILVFFNMLRQSDFFFLGKHLSSKEDSENFTLAFLTQTCQKNFGCHPTLKDVPFSSSLTFQWH